MADLVNSYRVKLQYKGVQKQMIARYEKAITSLKELGVRVNKPYTMDVEDLEMLVNHHRRTVETKRLLEVEQLEIAEENGLTEEDVNNRVNDLNWDVEHAIEVKRTEVEVETKEQRRARRKAEMTQILAELNAEEMAE